MNKRAGRTELRANHIAIAVAAAFAPWSLHAQTPPAPNTLPTGGVITHGSGTINAPVHTPTLSTMQIDQTSARMAAQFGSFSIGESAHVNVTQPTSSSIALFKDVGGSVSQIYGRLTANGQLFVSNPNGVLIGRTGRVEAAGFIASTLTLDENEFMLGGNSFNWVNNGATGRITNEGTILTPTGYTMLAGPQVLNDGLIIANRGSVVLAAGDRVSLDLIGDGLISVNVDQAALNASAINTGTIEAEGGKVVLAARSVNALLDTVVNAGGVIRASSLVERNGEIVLDGGSAGLVQVAGNHNAGSASVSGANISMSGTIVTDLGSGTQTITTPGTLSIQAGGGSAQNTGLIHQGSGEQKVTAGNLVVSGGTGIQTSALITSSDAAADQTINVAGGNISLTGGASGDGNQAVIRSAGDQRIDVGGMLTVEGGALSGPGGNNTALLVGAAANVPGKKQTINAGSIIVRSGAGGFQNGAVILGPRQEITTTGDVLLAGSGTGGTLGGVRMGGLSTGAGGVANTATDLTLNVGNDLLLSGGVLPTNSANIGSTTGLPQTITINATRDVIVGASPASVARIGTVLTTPPTNGTPGNISVTAGRDIRVNGGGEIVTTGQVTLKAANGAVNVNATSPFSGNARISSGAGQDVQAQSIIITAANGRTAQFVNSGGNQTVTASAIDITTQAGGGTAEIRNSTVGEQIINVAGGSIRLRGADSASGRAQIFSGGNQTINGNPDLFLTGGGTGIVGAGNDARIETALGTARQTIHAGRIVLENSALANSGTFSGLSSSHQVITTTGDVIMKSGTGAHPGNVRIQGGNGATELQLNVGGSLLLTGGNAPGGGVGLGSSAVSNNITVVAAGDVILNSGVNGARIGSSSDGTVGGNISISGRSIQLNGGASTAAIRTLDSVTLRAEQSGGTISQTGNGLVVANSLITSSDGSTSLTGPNEIARFNGTSGGPLTLVDSGTLQVTGITTTNDTITLTTDSLTNSGVISNGGGTNTANVILNADAFNLAGGVIEAGAAAVILRPKTGSNSFGIESAGMTTLTNADIASINTSDFVVFGSSAPTTFTGNMTVGQNAQVNGGNKNLAFFRTTNPGGTTTIGAQGLTTTGNVIVSGGGGSIVGTGTVSGDQVQLKASQGIGTPGARVRTSANALAVNTGVGAFVSEANDVTLRTVSLSVGGVANVTSNMTFGTYDLAAGGTVNVAGVVQSTGTMNVNAGGALNLNATAQDALLTSVGGQTMSAESVNLSAQNGRRANIENQGGHQEVTARTGGMNLQGVGGAGVAQIINNNVIPGDQTINVAGQLDILGGSTSTGSTNSGIFKNGPGGLQKVTAAGITLQGASTGTNAGAGIRSQGDQLIDVSGDINLRGGNGGTNNNAFLSANPTTPGMVGNQTIHARHINMSNGTGGVDTTATITAGKQLINASGNVILTAEGALVGTALGGPGVRIGAPGGTPLATDLTLNVGGNLVLNGGSAVDNGASIGSSGVAVPPTPNMIHIDAGGDVIMNAGNPSGTGVRIGSGSSGTAGGTISVKAGGTIQMNGARSATRRSARWAMSRWTALRSSRPEPPLFRPIC